MFSKSRKEQKTLELDKELKWSHNIWMGVSVEDKRVTQRIDWRIMLEQSFITRTNWTLPI